MPKRSQYANIGGVFFWGGVMRKILLMCALICAPFWAAAQETVSLAVGTDFTIYPTARPTTATPDRVEIVYFFWYGSPWAREIDRELRVWAKTRPYSVKLLPAPVIFNARHEIFGARVFFALDLLGKEEEISPLLLEAVSQKQLDFNSVPAVIQWMEQRGIPKKQFLDALDDPRTKAHTVHVKDVMKTYGVQSVPTVVINGKYNVRASNKVPPQRVLQVVKILTQRVSEVSQKR